MCSSKNDSNSTNFNTSQFFLEVEGFQTDHFDVLQFSSIPLDSALDSFEGQHSFSEDYCFNLTVHTKEWMNTTTQKNIPNKNCILIINGESGLQKIHGIITAIESAKKTHKGFEHVLQIHSPLFPLKLQSPSRVFIQKTVLEILESVFKDYQWLKGQEGQYEIKTEQQYHKIECSVQFEQSDFEFALRLMNRYGLYFYFEDLNNHWKLIIIDDKKFLIDQENTENQNIDQNIKQSTLNQNIYKQPNIHTYPILLHYNPIANHQESLISIWPSWQIKTDHYLYTDYNANNPTEPFKILSRNNTNIIGIGEFHLHGEHFKNQEEGIFLSRVKQESLDWQREVYYAKSTYTNLKPGSCIIITDHKEKSLNGEYIIISIHHQGDQSGAFYGKQQSSNLRYYSQLLLIKSFNQFRKPEHRAKRYQGTLRGMIDGIGENGNYYFRFIFDDKNIAMKGSPATPQIQHFAGGGDGIGFHFPNQAGTLIEIVFMHGDINRPVILGALFDKNHQNPVTAENCTQNRLITYQGNELLMEDKIDEEKIMLSTQNQNNTFILDATKNKENVTLKSIGDIKFESINLGWNTNGDSFIETGQNFISKVKNNYFLMAQNGKYHSQHDIFLQNTKDIILKAEQNEWFSKKNITIECGNFNLNLLNDNCEIKTEQGNIELNIVQDVQWIARESISFSNAGATIVFQKGNIEIKTPGVIKINAKRNLEFIGSQNRGQ